MVGRHDHRWLVVALMLAALSLFLAACGGDGGPERLAAPTATAKAAPTPVSVPPRPDDFDEYPEAIAAYLSEAGEPVLRSPCLADLLEAWKMPFGREHFLAPPEPPKGARCMLGNTDTDPDDEVIVVLSAWPPDLPGQNRVLANLVVFDRTDTRYQVAFESVEDEPSGLPFFPDSIVAAEDVTGDGAGDLVYTHTDCGAHTCHITVRVLTGDGSDYRDLTSEGSSPEGSITMATAEVWAEDIDGDGTEEIVLHGGTIQSVGAGPQRTRTEIYAWDGQQYSLTSIEYDPSELRYFRVRDADDAFSKGDYELAIGLYQEAMSDPGLGEVTYRGSREELMAYSTFRLSLSHLKLGATKAASQQIEAVIAHYPVSLHGKAAATFRNAIGLTQLGYSGQISTGCLAVSDFAIQNLERFREVWNYGYANPAFDPEALCPFGG